MRTLVSILVSTSLAALLIVGCGDDEVKPKITRLHASETCGVAPLRVDFRVDATGGAARDEATGVNNWLSVTWDFGDGTRIEDGTSVAYHEYEIPDLYTVVCTVEDADGASATDSLHVWVRDDTLTVNAVGRLEGEIVDEVETCRPLELDIVGSACDFDSESDNLDRFVFTWDIRDSTYVAPNPEHPFHPDALEGGSPTEHDLIVTIFDPEYDIYRRDTSQVTVLPSEGADLRVSSNWELSPIDPSDTDSLSRFVDGFPDTLIYSVFAVNEGLADGYNVRIDGEFPTRDGQGNTNIRLEHIGGDATDGIYTYYPPTETQTHFWTWDLPLFPSGSAARLDVTVVFESADKYDRYEFPLEIAEYWCDAAAVDNEATPFVRIESAPSDLSLRANWSQTPADENLGPSLQRRVPADPGFPDRVRYTMQVVNAGPSEAFDLVVTGTLPDDPRVAYGDSVTVPASDTFDFDPVTRTWTWEIPSVVSVKNLIIDLDIAETPIDESFEFPAEISPYPEDPTPDDHGAVATYTVFSSISDLSLATSWYDREGDLVSPGPDLDHDILAFPDGLTLRHTLTNEGPYEAREFSVSGVIAGESDPRSLLEDAHDFQLSAAVGEIEFDPDRGTWRWTLPALADGESASLDLSFLFQLFVDVNQEDRPFLLRSEIDSYIGDPNAANDEVESNLWIRSLPEK